MPGTNQITIEDVELYRKHVIYYFDNQMGADMLNLPEDKKDRMFQMLHDYADILEAIFHDGIPILEHIVYGDEYYTAKQNPHDGIDWDHECEIVKEYKAWKASKGL